MRSTLSPLILAIAQDRAMREDFRNRFRRETNSQELRKLVIDYLGGVAEDIRSRWAGGNGNEQNLDEIE